MMIFFYTKENFLYDEEQKQFSKQKRGKCS